ncbi:MAG: ABC transporter ATP-binding protein [Actinobacteria bacterium]|nr:ABC transporter ATP-binding protein [Actinomycetota bacterium]
MAATTPKLVVERASRAFDDAPALAPTSLAVAAGEFVSLVGPSGCGKSTLFNVVSGLLAPDAGRVLIDGADATGRPGSVGYMLQKDLLAPWRTVLGNIVLGAALTRGVTAADRAEAAALAVRHGLGGYLDHYPHALSGGMRQRVALLRTLATGRDLLLLDEPFGALDAQTRLGMQRWLLEVRAQTGSTVLFITHDVDEAIFLSDRILVMGPRPGAIVDELAVDLPRPRTLAMATAPAAVEAKRRILATLHGEAAT